MSSPKQATLVFKKFNSNSRHNSRTTRVFWPRINKKVSVFFHAMILHSLLQLPEWVHPCSLKRMTIATLKGKAISHTAMQTNCAESELLFLNKDIVQILYFLIPNPQELLWMRLWIMHAYISYWKILWTTYRL